MQRRAGRRFVRGLRGVRPSRTWADVSQQFVMAAVTVTSSATLIQLQAPASLASLTADPPEDLTILRIRGCYSTTMAGSAVANWTLALTVADVTWTPGATFTVDADKRILWSRTYQASNATADAWNPPGYQLVGGTPFPTVPEMVMVDISPKVKVEAGRALVLVAYENVSGASLTVTSQEMRVLFQRSGRK